MNPSVSCCTSSEEQGGETNWVCESWGLGNPAMSVGTLDSGRQTFHGGAAGRVDWDWDMNIATNNNPLLLSSHHRHHHHHHHDHHDSDEHKPHLMPSASAPTFRQYNGVMGPFSGHQNNALGLLNSSGIRSFEGSNDGMNPPPPPSFHPGLLYSEMPGFGAGGFGCGDSRSQLLGMMSMQQQAEHHHHHHKEGGFHDIVKREELCAGDFQARIGLNLGHRTYFSAEDTAVSRLYKRPRAIPPASQVPRCQAEGCKADLTNAKHYHRRHKVCEFHSKATSVVTGGVQQRFCQQCSRFHVLAEFDEVKRSCRKRLADHNRRRRKPQTNTIVPTVSTAEAATALKVEDDNNNVSGNCNNTARGTVQSSASASASAPTAPVLRTEAQALLNAMSLPLILQNTKGSQMSNNNTNTTNATTNNPMLQQANSQKVTVANQQYVQQSGGGGGHKGPNLSLSSSSVGMSLCNQRQTTAQDYSGLELALPWLRTTSEYSGSNHRPPPAMDNILHPIISHEKSNVEAFSAASVQNFLPLTGSMSSRELGSSQWMVGSSDSASSLEAGQQMFSLLEPAEHHNRTEEQSHTARPVEYLSHRHQGGLNSKEPVDGNSEAKFSEMQNSLRPFGQSIYDGSM